MKQKRTGAGCGNAKPQAGSAAGVVWRRKSQIVRPRIALRNCRPIVVLFCAAGLSGCNEGVFDPQGPVAVAERQILFNSLGIMLTIVIPVILATLGVAFWFRSSNRCASYLPDFNYSGRLEVLVWSIPLMTVLLVGGVAWVGAHDLDPRRSINTGVRPLQIQVVSLDWKWLFVYPDQGIASVNHLVIPADTPISLELTSAGVMNSFFVPQLGSQIYTMAGMTTHLQLQADHVGSYPGLSAQFSGDGFADMTFRADAVPEESFSLWMEGARAVGPVLDAKAYADLTRPSKAVAPFTYRSVASDLFSRIVMPGMSMNGQFGRLNFASSREVQ
jgi:cytochrome o ubiquinol oxidase subunit II